MTALAMLLGNKFRDRVFEAAPAWRNDPIEARLFAFGLVEAPPLLRG
jgi:hypothetical protein